jgi:DNA polymerase III epsilon subunit-like protein
MTYSDEHVIYVDTETTGLDPERHEIWDIALIRGDTGEEIEYHIAPNLSTADPTALRLTDYYKRVNGAHFSWNSPSIAATMVARYTAGKHIVGAVPSFDAVFLERLLRRHNLAPAWHYHLIDIEALAAGYLGMKPPWDSDELNQRLGLPEVSGKHTAIGDARWAKAVYERVLYERETP